MGVRILVMASGNGSNFQALIDAIGPAKAIPSATITRLIVNRNSAYARQRAAAHDIPCTYHNLVSHGFMKKTAPGVKAEPAEIEAARARYDAALADMVLSKEWEAERPHLIVLAGWMHVFGDAFLDPMAAAGIRIINLHPALPGKYDGSHAIERAFRDFEAGTLENNKTGIMVHHVIRQVDRGSVVLTREIECREGDTLETLEERIHGHEHELLVEATGKMVDEILAEQKERE